MIDHALALLADDVIWLEFRGGGLSQKVGRVSASERIMIAFAGAPLRVEVAQVVDTLPTSTVHLSLLPTTRTERVQEPSVAIMSIASSLIVSVIFSDRKSIEDLSRLGLRDATMLNHEFHLAALRSAAGDLPGEDERGPRKRAKQKKRFLVNPPYHEMSFDGASGQLTGIESQLLGALLRPPGIKILDIDMAKMLWGVADEKRGLRLEWHCSQLRKKLINLVGIKNLIRRRSGVVWFDVQALGDVEVIVAD